MSFKPPPVVFCGPSGVGKSTLLKQLMQEFPNLFGFSISHTTRSPREGELNGREYHFVSREVMEEAIRNNEFIESATYSGNLYGTSKKSVQDVQANGRMCILDIEIQGVRQIKNTDLNPRLIFVKPPSIEDLKSRLINRGTETEESLGKRLAVAIEEMEYGETPGNFDLIIVNDDVATAYSKLRTFLLPDVQELQNYLQKNPRAAGAGDQ